MRKQIVKIIYRGIYTVVYDDAVRFNPFRIYFERNGKKRLQEKYGDFSSCMYWLNSTIGNFEDMEV